MCLHGTGHTGTIPSSGTILSGRILSLDNSGHGQFRPGQIRPPQVCIWTLGRMLGDDFVLGDNSVRTILSFGPFSPDDRVLGLFCPGQICPRAEYHGESVSQHATTGCREVPKVCEWYIEGEMEF